MRSAPGMRKFVGRYRDGDDRLLPVRMRFVQTAIIGRLVRGMREKPGTVSCDERISAPLFVPSEFPFRMRRVAAALRKPKQ